MSRTRHHSHINEAIRSKRKKLIEFKQKQLNRLKIDEWYIELPISKQLTTRNLVRK
jgi:hypothetical protein